MKSMHRSLLALLLVTPCIADAQELVYLPPQALIESALLSQPEVRAAAARADAARADARVLDVGSYEYQASLIPQRRTTDSEGRFVEWEAQLDRQLRLPGKARLDRQIGTELTRAAELNFEDAVHQSARQLLDLWMAWIRSAGAARIADAQVSLIERERKAVARRVEEGDAAHLDLDLIQAEHAQARARATAANAALQAAREQLAITYPRLPVPERVPVLPDPQALADGAEHWQALIVERSHEIGMAKAQAAAQVAVAERAKADRRPDPSIGLRAMRERGGAESVLGVVLSVPIGTAYRSARAASESASAHALEAQAEAVQRVIAQEARATARGAETAYALWQAQQAALQAHEAATHRSRRAWELGEGSLSQYLLTEKAAQQVRLDEGDARVDACAALLKTWIDSHELWHL